MITLSQLIRSGRLDGYDARPPGGWDNEWVQADREAAEATPCAECGARNEYRPFSNQQTGSYLALTVCEACGATDQI